VLRQRWLVSLERLVHWLDVREEDLSVEDRRLLREQRRLVWGSAVALYAAALLLEYVIDPPLLGLSRWLLARSLIFLLVMLVVAVVTRLIAAQWIARLRDGEAGRGSGEQLAQLQAALRVHAKLDQDKELFVTSLSHDLRGLLTTMKGYAQMLQRHAARSEAAGGLQGLRRIEGAASRAAAMLDELRDLRQLQAGRPLELRREQVDLMALIRDVLGEYEPVAMGHDLRLESPLPALVGEWDRARVARVVGNLLSNAVKYSPAGGQIVVRVSSAEDADRCWAVVAVHDEGVGISEAEIRHVFEPFYRGSHAAGPIEGSGIGLMSARWIVEQHGGTIGVESQPGAGSTFTVRLPVVAEPRAMPAAPAPERPVPGGVQASPRGWALPRRAPRAVKALVMLPIAAVLVLGLGGAAVRLQTQLAMQRRIEGLLAQAEQRPLAAADPVSGASGRAYVDPTTDQMLVVVSRLPQLPADRTYQLWFVRPGGMRDSGGIFRVDEGGQGTILARAPAGLGAYTAIGITEEPSGGSPGPTGPKIVGASLAGSS
jgi:signal transduction histidine kinase